MNEFLNQEALETSVYHMGSIASIKCKCHLEGHLRWNTIGDRIVPSPGGLLCSRPFGSGDKRVQLRIIRDERNEPGNGP